jgi:molybdenum cofactor biosynthesis enzyme MoaA
LGKDIDPVLSQQNQISTHFSEWKNFNDFLIMCWENAVTNIYVTGQNTDALMYRYLPELIDYLQDECNLNVGIRTNGYLSHKHIETMRKCRRSVGLSIHSLNSDTNKLIMGRNCEKIIDWANLIPQLNRVRVSIVVNRYNEKEIFGLMHYISRFPNVKYIQLRRICTDSREEFLLPDVEAFERIAKKIKKNKHMEPIGDFYGAPLYNIYGKEVCVWRTVKTDIDSYNYFTDGTISDEYFVVEGYMRDSVNYPKIDLKPIDAHGQGLEGFWR